MAYWIYWEGVLFGVIFLFLVIIYFKLAKGINKLNTFLTDVKEEVEQISTILEFQNSPKVNQKPVYYLIASIKKDRLSDIAEYLTLNYGIPHEISLRFLQQRQPIKSPNLKRLQEISKYLQSQGARTLIRRSLSSSI